VSAAPPQQGSGQSDNSLAPFWIIAASLATCFIVWQTLHAEIVQYFLKFKLQEAIFISYFTSSIDPLVNWLQSRPASSYAEMTPSQLLQVSEMVGKYLRWPILVAGVLLGIYIYQRSPRLKFRQTYSMQSLVSEEEDDWPQITPVVKLDLVKTHLDTGPWSSAMTPLQFVKKYKIFKELPAETTEPTLAHKMQFYVSLLPDQAYRILSMQLGKVWTSIADLPIHVQALVAAFIAKGEGDTQVSAALLAQISRSSASGKLDFSGVRALINKYGNKKKVQKICSSHAYMLTVMASLLQYARTDGVLSSADFLWLKPLDRPLWYMLNGVGRQTPFVEVAGPFAHWKAELEFGHPIQVPMVGEAVKALEAALKEILYVPEDLKEA